MWSGFKELKAGNSLYLSCLLFLLLSLPFALLSPFSLQFFSSLFLHFFSCFQFFFFFSFLFLSLLFKLFFLCHSQSFLLFFFFLLNRIRYLFSTFSLHAGCPSPLRETVLQGVPHSIMFDNMAIQTAGLPLFCTPPFVQTTEYLWSQ